MHSFLPLLLGLVNSIVLIMGLAHIYPFPRYEAFTYEVPGIHIGTYVERPCHLLIAIIKVF